jgi:acyl carrier protein
MQANDQIQMDVVLDQIKHIVTKLPGCFLAFGQIHREHQLREDVGLDSLAMVDLMIAIEDYFHVYFDPILMDLVEVFETIGSLTDFVINLKSN